MQAIAPINPRIRRWIIDLLVNHQGWSKLNYLGEPGQLLAGLGCKQTDPDELCLKTARRDLNRAWKQICRTPQAQDPLPARLAANITRIQALADLNQAECRILEFAICLHANFELNSTLELFERLSTNQLNAQLAKILELTEADVRTALSISGALFRTGILDTCTLSSSFRQSLSGRLMPSQNHFVDVLYDGQASIETLLKDSLQVAAKTRLKLSDYLPLKTQLDTLLPYLKHSLANRQQGVNILLYGPPGTGKTELARLLGKACKTNLYELCCEDTDGEELSATRRLASYRMAQSFLARESTLLIFDETDDVLNSIYGGSKAWINQLLENNPVPAIWILNDVSCLDNAYIRRFDMVLEMPYPEQDQRRKLLKRYSQGLLDAATLEQLSEQTHLTPAIIARAARVIGSVAEKLPDSAAAMHSLTREVLQAQGLYVELDETPAPKNSPNAARQYNPAYIQADCDLAAMVPRLKEHPEARICLYGPPGTGKTAYGYWLAEQLDMPMTVCRASDLLGPYVGETEQKIAWAFAQAEQDGSILMIDEVDSFLRDRRAANARWEAGMVNEMLTQMERFTGIFIASTNLMDGLDQAVLRRFDLKTKFDFLKPEQAWNLFEHHRKTLKLRANTALKNTVHSMAWLTPGDFAAVARQGRFNPVASALDLQQRLAVEMGYKEQANKRRIGF